MENHNPDFVRKQNERRLQYLSFFVLALGLDIGFTDKSLLVKRCLKFMFFFLMAMCNICIFGLAYFAYTHVGDIVAASESISLVFQLLITIIKSMFIYSLQYEFRKILNTIANHQIVNDTKVLQKNVSFTRPLQLEANEILNKCWKTAIVQFNFFIIPCVAVTSFYFFSAVGNSVYRCVIGDTNVTFAHVYPTEYPFWKVKHNNFPYYEIIVIMDGLADYTAVLCAVVFDGLFIVMTLHAVALLRILKKMILYSTSEHVKKEGRLYFVKQCIDLHERCSQFCNDVNALYSKATLMQFFGSLLELGIVLFELTVGFENDKATLFKMITYMMAAVFELVIYCLDGEMIIIESDTLPYSWYQTDWYNESNEFQKYIYMMIMRTNKPIILWAYGFVSLSLATFLSIAKTSASYFLVLRNLIH